MLSGKWKPSISSSSVEILESKGPGGYNLRASLNIAEQYFNLETSSYVISVLGPRTSLISSWALETRFKFEFKIKLKTENYFFIISSFRPISKNANP